MVVPLARIDLLSPLQGNIGPTRILEGMSFGVRVAHEEDQEGPRECIACALSMSRYYPNESTLPSAR